MFHKGERGDKGDPGAPGITTGAKHAFITLSIIIFALAAMALFIGVRQVLQTNHQEAQIALNQARIGKALRAQCGADKSIGDLAAAKVVPVPTTHKASKVGIQIISANRAAWRGLGCPGHLAKSSPSFVKWAGFYKLPAS